MKAILLAAGRGTRISRYLDGNPKCTVDLGNGTKLIEHSIAMLKKKGITEIAMATGDRHRVIEDLLAGSCVKYFYNPFFDFFEQMDFYYQYVLVLAFSLYFHLLR